MAIKVYGGNHGIATANVIPDNQVALTIESTDSKDYITIDTSDGAEILALNGGGSAGQVLQVKAGITQFAASGTMALLAEDPTATNPVFCPRNNDTDTGIGSAALDQISLIAGGVERARLYNKGVTITGYGGTTGGSPNEAEDVALYVENSTGNATNASIIEINSDGNNSGVWFSESDTLKGYVGTIGGHLYVNTNSAAGDLIFRGNSAEIMRVDSGAAAVGIGVAAPEHLLHVQDGDLGIVTNSADDVAKSLVFTKSKNATDGGHTPVDDDTVLGNIVFEGSDSTGAFEPGAKIRAQVAAGTIGDGRVPSELIFSTAPDSASAPLDALVINPSGFVEVQSPTNGARLHFMDGATERAGLKAFSGGLYVDTADSAHDIFFRPGGSTTSLCIDAGNTFVGILDVTPTKALDVKNGASGGDILCYDIYTHDGGVTSSDERMKENIVETQFGLDFINTLNPVSYKWKDTDEYSEMRTVPATDGEPEHEEVANTFEAVEYTRTHHGLIAQQVNQAVTDAGLTATEFAGYTYDPERDQHGLRYQEFIAPLIKAVQELTARIATLEAGD